MSIRPREGLTQPTQPGRPQPPPSPPPSAEPPPSDRLDERNQWLACRDHRSALSIMWVDMAEAQMDGFRLPPIAPMLLRSCALLEAALGHAVNVRPKPLHLPARCDSLSVEMGVDLTAAERDYIARVSSRVTGLDCIFSFEGARPDWVPPSMSCFPRLRLLRITNAPFGFPRPQFTLDGLSRLTSVHLDDVDVSCAELAALPCLTSLTVGGDNFTDLRSLACSQSLQTLRILGCRNLTSHGIHGLERIATLTELSFGFVPRIDDIGHLCTSASIKRLVLVNGPQLSQVRGMVRLESLSCVMQPPPLPLPRWAARAPQAPPPAFAYPDIDWLASLPALTDLDLTEPVAATCCLDPIFRVATLRRLKVMQKPWLLSSTGSRPSVPPTDAWLCRELCFVATNMADLITAAATFVTTLHGTIKGGEFGPLNSWTARGLSTLASAVLNAHQLRELVITCDGEAHDHLRSLLGAAAACPHLRTFSVSYPGPIDLSVIAPAKAMHALRLFASALRGALAPLPALEVLEWSVVKVSKRSGTASKANLQTPWDAVLDSLAKQPTLRYVKLRCPAQITSVAALQRSISLRQLDVSGCSNLRSLEGLDRIPTLTKLDVTGCGELALDPLARRYLLTASQLRVKLREEECRVGGPFDMVYPHVPKIVGTTKRRVAST